MPAAGPMAVGNVFLVDDDPMVLRAVSRLLRSVGYQVSAFADATSYLVFGVPDPPACLLIDVRLPDMSGFDLHNAIMGTPRALPVVFITGYRDEGLRTRALASGAVDVLFKPLDERDLVRAIEAGLALSRPYS